MRGTLRAACTNACATRASGVLTRLADLLLTLVAREGDKASQPASIRLHCDGVKPGEAVLPRLRGLFVGVSDYKLPNLKLGLAAKDATDLAAFKTQEARLITRSRRDCLPMRIVRTCSMAWIGWRKARRKVTSI
jgi:hypothetical protein